MNKAELISAISEKTEGITKSDIEKILKACTASIHEELKKGGRVQIVDLGSFKVIKREEREVRNPRTGAKIKTPACIVPKFVAAKALKDALN